MPSGKTHVMIGTGVTLALTCAFSFPVETIWFGAAAALVPDIDTRKSLLGRWIPVWLIAKHRGFTHSFFGVCVFTFLCFLCVRDFYITAAFATGYLSHLVSDARTPKGIQWRWPDRTYYRLRLRRWR